MGPFELQFHVNCIETFGLECFLHIQKFYIKKLIYYLSEVRMQIKSKEQLVILERNHYS